jgi:hypothetical protein
MLTARREGQELPAMVVARWRWYRAAVTRHRRRYVLLELVTIGTAAAIPVAAAARLNAVVLAALGALVLVATGVRTMLDAHENWIDHSGVANAIEREAALYFVQAPPYQGSDAARELVTRVEAASRDGRQRWASRRIRIEHAPAGLVHTQSAAAGEPAPEPES